MTATVFAFANQKGGVGKTTTALSVAAAMAEMGRAVLAIDLDPQACLTFSLGFEPDDLEPTLNDMVVGRVDLAGTILQHDEVDVAPSNIDLAGAEVTLLSRTGREYLLRGQIAELADSYDAILIDCAPSLGVLTINGLTAADEVIIPVQCETLSHRGVAQLLETIHDVRRWTNRELNVRGLVATMFDARTNHAKEVLQDLVARYEVELIGPPVRKSIRFAEAPTDGRSPLAAGLDVPGVAAYRCIARELLGEPVPDALYEAARWTPRERAEVLGLDYEPEPEPEVPEVTSDVVGEEPAAAVEVALEEPEVTSDVVGEESAAAVEVALEEPEVVPDPVSEAPGRDAVASQDQSDEPESTGDERDERRGPAEENGDGLDLRGDDETIRRPFEVDERPPVESWR